MAPALILAACGITTSPLPVPDWPEDTDDPIRTSTAESELSLIARYNATIAVYPKLSAKLGPLRDQHAQHLVAMRGSPGNSEPEVSVSPGDRKSVIVATTAAAAIIALTIAERVAAQQRADACGKAATQQLAWTLSLIGACEAQHSAVLASVKA